MKTHEYTGGRSQPITALLDADTHGLARQYHGKPAGRVANAAPGGWTLHLYSRDTPNILSPNLGGDSHWRTSQGLMADVCRAYGPNRQVILVR